MNSDACNHIPIACVNSLCSVAFVGSFGRCRRSCRQVTRLHRRSRKKRGCIIPIHPLLLKISLYVFLILNNSFYLLGLIQILVPNTQHLKPNTQNPTYLFSVMNMEKAWLLSASEYSSLPFFHTLATSFEPSLSYPATYTSPLCTTMDWA